MSETTSKKPKTEDKSVDATEPIASNNNTNKHQSTSNFALLDLRTTQGQILFLLISILLSVLIQSLPNDTIKALFKTNIANQIDNTVITPIECNRTIFGEAAGSVRKQPSYWIYVRSGNENHLRHVKYVADRFGFEKVTNQSNDWDLLWAHDYPFRVMYPKLHNLRPHQRVNHLPGCGFITNKVDLATSDSKYIPKAFRLPDDRDKFDAYVKENPTKMFVQKNNQHRHITIKSIDQIDFDNNDTFIQEYIANPLLVDGHKFDIGVYVIIASVDPLRVYIYKGDVLFRYCPQKYHPFDPQNVDKYIVGDDYLPTWEVPSLATFYNGLRFGMKDSFDAYLKVNGRDPNVVWQQVEDAIRSAIVSKEHHLANALKSYRNKRNFFEMMRFDLIIDDDLRVYLMEANMSPNLSSAHFLQNTLLYEQVIFNLFSLVGVASTIQRESFRTRSSDIEQMLSSDKNIAVFAEECASDKCTATCELDECALCRPCLSSQDISDLHKAYREHINRGDTKRIFPVPITTDSMTTPSFAQLSPKNQMMTRWFEGKCAMDSSWCS